MSRTSFMVERGSREGGMGVVGTPAGSGETGSCIGTTSSHGLSLPVASGNVRRPSLRRHPTLHPRLEPLDLLGRPGLVAGHVAVLQPLQDRLGVLLHVL